MSEEKILEIIKEQAHITVKLENKPLMNRIREMENKGLIEFKERHGTYFYYGRPGEYWSLNG